MRAVAVVYTYIILMLSDLASQGCAELGSEAVNNPLSRLGKAVLDYGRQQAHVGGSSMEGGGNTSANDATLPLHHQNIMMPQPSLGPTGLLPEMGPSEQQFLRAFEAGDVLQRGWEHAADVNRKAPAFVPSVGRGEFAWERPLGKKQLLVQTNHCMSDLHTAAQICHTLIRRMYDTFHTDHPFNERHHLHRHPGNLVVNAFPPHLQALEHGWRDASQVENAAQSTMRESTGRFSTAAPTASPLSANEVRLLDDAHERAAIAGFRSRKPLPCVMTSITQVLTQMLRPPHLVSSRLCGKICRWKDARQPERHLLGTAPLTWRLSGKL